MKIVSFAKMLTLPKGTIFCLVDVPDDFAMGPLCRKGDSDLTACTFEYTHIGAMVAMPDNEEEAMDYVDAIHDKLQVQDDVDNVGCDDDTLYVQSAGDDELCHYAIYSDYQLERMIATLTLARDLNVRKDLHPSGGQS